MHIPVRFGVACLMVILWTMSCQPNQPPAEELIIGEWNIVEAKRNNRTTTTLRDAFFKFAGEQGMTTNILGDTSVYEYTVEGEMITQLSDENIIYQIYRLSGDTLHLKSRIRNYQFDFVAIRKQE